jgi:hypothetical protein
MEKCAFCPRVAKLSAEHCWPVWISELLPTDEFTLRRTAQDGSVNEWTSPTLNLTTKVVCEPCNNEWMSQLEQDAKATLANMILHSGPISLLPSGIDLIAAYAFKGAVVANFMNSDRAPFHSEADRHRFARDRSVPAGFQVWISSFPKPRGAFKSYFHKTRPEARHNFHLDVFTFAAGFFVMQAVSFRWATRHYRRHWALRSVTQDSKFDDFSIPLWPSDGRPVLWPPRKHLAEADLKTFVTRWTNLRLSA